MLVEVEMETMKKRIGSSILPPFAEINFSFENVDVWSESGKSSLDRLLNFCRKPNAAQAKHILQNGIPFRRTNNCSISPWKKNWNLHITELTNLNIISNWQCAPGGNIGHHGSEWGRKDNPDERDNVEELGGTQDLRETHGEWEGNQEEHVDKYVRLRPTRRSLHRYSHCQGTPTIPGTNHESLQ